MADPELEIGVRVSSDPLVLVDVSMVIGADVEVLSDAGILADVDVGLQGRQGLQGIQGVPGTAGVDGSDGAQGATGPTGAVGPVGPPGPAIQHFFITHLIPGNVEVKLYPFQSELLAEWQNIQFIRAKARLRTAPVGSSLRIDILVNGVSIFDNDAQKINVADGALSGSSATLAKALSSGDVIEVEAEQVGSTTPGADASVQVVLEKEET